MNMKHDVIIISDDLFDLAPCLREVCLEKLDKDLQAFRTVTYERIMLFISVPHKFPGRLKIFLVDNKVVELCNILLIDFVSVVHVCALLV
jgi:hypothetical protein